MTVSALQPLQASSQGASEAAPAPAFDQDASAWTGWVCVGLAALTPFLAMFGNLGFAPVVALAGILVAPFALSRRAPWPVLGLLALALCWAVASMTWSPFHPPAPHRAKDLEAITGLKLALQLLTYGALVAAAPRVPGRLARLAMTVLAIGMAVLSVVLIVETADSQAAYLTLRRLTGQGLVRSDWGTRDVARAVYVLALLYWPLALALARRGATWAAVGMFVASAAAGVGLNVDSPLVALAVSGLVMLLVQGVGRRGIVAVGAGVVVYVLFAPLAVALVAPHLPGAGLQGGLAKASWGARVEIWRFVDGLILQNPLRGWGLDASRVYPGVIPLHPHDAALQLWLELGVAGAALAALVWTFVMAAIVRLHRRDPGLAAAACASAAAYVIIGALSFGVWQEWWLALGALAAVVVTLVDRMREASVDPASELTALPPAS